MIGYISFKIVAMAKDDNLPYAWLIQLLSTQLLSNIRNVYLAILIKSNIGYWTTTIFISIKS